MWGGIVWFLTMGTGLVVAAVFRKFLNESTPFGLLSERDKKRWEWFAIIVFGVPLVGFFVFFAAVVVPFYRDARSSFANVNRIMLQQIYHAKRIEENQVKITDNQDKIIKALSGR